MSVRAAAVGAVGSPAVASGGPAVSDRQGIEFQLAEPFPHLVLDDFLPRQTARAAAHLFDQPCGRWREGIHRHSRKWTDNCPAVRDWVQSAGLANPEFLARLEAMTGIRPLVADPELKGGGLHLSRPGSYLDLHADFTVHEALGMRRALNLLIYLTREYDEAWGGQLELWDRRVRRCVQRIAPRFNRAVLFATSDTSWHGHPDPMGGPPGAERRSLALYYYTPWTEGAPRLTTTRYRARPWEYRERVRLHLGRLRRWLAR